MAFLLYLIQIGAMKESNDTAWNWKMILIFVAVFLFVSQILSDWDHFKEGLFSAF
jgi:hypothetical protein